MPLLRTQLVISTVLFATFASGCAQSHLPAIYIATPEVQTQLRASRVTILLPRYLPTVTSADPLHIQLLSLDKSHYSLVLAHDERPCQGQSVCAYGTLEANAAPIYNSDQKPQTVRLAHGIAGQFFPSSCGSNCTEAYITWHQGQFFYSIGIKAGRRRELIDAANSAIPNSSAPTEP